jgi:hypothetical protein
MSASIHFARVLPARKGRGALPVALCAAITGLVTTTSAERVTCQRCLRLMPAPPEPISAEEEAMARADHAYDEARDRELTGE